MGEIVPTMIHYLNRDMQKFYSDKPKNSKIKFDLLTSKNENLIVLSGLKESEEREIIKGMLDTLINLFYIENLSETVSDKYSKTLNSLEECSY